MARRQLASIHLLHLDQAILDRASAVEPGSLRSLDALHLASALALGEQLGALLTYDRRMIEGAMAIGIPVTSPG
ncbi:MAG: PIN domain-containing protein [Candidatus Dormibacteria bacterium]